MKESDLLAYRVGLRLMYAWYELGNTSMAFKMARFIGHL